MAWANSAVELLASGLLVLAFLRVAYTDMTRMKIENRLVIVILAIYVATLPTFGLNYADLLLGAGLFVLGLVFWLLGKMGAGDVKLLAATGLVIGVADAAAFALLSLVLSIIFLVLLFRARRLLLLPIAVSTRLIEFAEAGKIPYGVPIALAALPILVSRMIRVVSA